MPFSDSIKLLGVVLDSELTLDRHAAEVARCCNYHIRALRHIRPLLTADAAKLVAQGIVCARLDYCNGLLQGTSSKNLDRLQKVQNSLARAVCQHLGPPASPSCGSRYTGCRFVSASTSRQLLLPTKAYTLDPLPTLPQFLNPINHPGL